MKRLLLLFFFFSITLTLFAQDSSSFRWQIKYSASFNYFPFTTDNHVEISPAALQLEFFKDKFGVYVGPRLFDKYNDESPFHPEGQTFKQRIGFTLGMDYTIFSIGKKVGFLLLYNFQYHYKVGHGPFPDPNDPNDLEKSDDYYFENTAGAGAYFNISRKANIALSYSMGNLRIKKNLDGTTETKDYTDHLVELSVGYNLN